MFTKRAAELVPGDVVDLGASPRTVKATAFHPTGIPETAVLVQWVETDRTSTIRADKDITVLNRLPHLWPCGCLRNDSDAHRVGCPEHPEGKRGF